MNKNFLFYALYLSEKSERILKWMGKPYTGLL